MTREIQEAFNRKDFYSSPRLAAALSRVPPPGTVFA